MKVVVSCISDSGKAEPALEAFRHRPHQRIEVQPLNDTERRDIIREVPSLSAKALDDDQIALLLKNPATANPLFLLVALEELRGFGSYEQLNDRIANFPRDGDTVTAIFTQVFERLAEEFNRTLAETVLTLLASARRGLSEGELYELVAGLGGADDLFPVLRQVRPYLLSRSGILTFYHRNVGEAIHCRYLARSEDECTARRRLADYFAAQLPSERRADELPWLLQQAEEWDRLKDCLADISIFDAYEKQGLDYELHGYWLSLADRADPAAVYEEALIRYEQRHMDADEKWNGMGHFLRLAGRFAGADRAFQRALALRERNRGPDSFEVGQTLNNLAVLHESQGDMIGAEALFRRSLSIVERTKGPEDIETGRILNGLAMALNTQGRWAEAAPHFERSLAIRERVLGPDHPETAQGVNNLGAVYESMGDDDRAELLYRRALSIREGTLGRDHPDTAVSLNNLALLLARLGRDDEAEAMFHRALVITERALGLEHPDHARSVQNLGVFYAEQGNHAAAEPLARQALAIVQKTRGTDHPHLASSLTNLAFILRQKGEPGAESMLRQALEISERSQGPEHPETAVSLLNLAIVLNRSDRAAEALRLLRRAADIAGRVHGADHLVTAAIQGALAARLADTGEPEEAVRLCRAALATREKVLGPEHLHTARALKSLVSLLGERKTVDEEAEALFRRAAALHERLYGLAHPETVFARSQLAAYLCRSGRQEEGIGVFRQDAEQTEATTGADAPRTWEAWRRLANALKRAAQPAAAEELLQRIMALFRQGESRGHRVDVDTRVREAGQAAMALARLFEEQEHWDKAEELFRFELELSERDRGKDHTDVAVSLFHLATLLRKKGILDEAENCLRRAVAIHEAADGTDHPETAESLNDLADLLTEIRPSEARELARRSLWICETAYGAEHPETRRSLTILERLTKGE